MNTSDTAFRKPFARSEDEGDAKIYEATAAIARLLRT